MITISTRKILTSYAIIHLTAISSAYTNPLNRRHHLQSFLKASTSSQQEQSTLSLYQNQFKPPNNKRNLKWEQRRKELEEYRSVHGNSNVPQTYKPNPGLGRWVRRQRVDYAKIATQIKPTTNIEDAEYPTNVWDGCNELTKYRIQNLMDLDFVFDRKSDIWNTRLRELKEFKKEHGHVIVPQHYSKGEKWYKLGIWVRNQRAMYNRLKDDPVTHQDGTNNGVYNFLTEERIQLLNDVEFCWDVQAENWMEQYERLVDYYEEFGSSDVPSRYRNDPALSRWVQEQRGNKDSLDVERIALLDEIEFVWGNKNDMQWWNTYDAMCEYKKKYGTIYIPADYDDYKLFNWMSNTKQKCKQFCDLVKTKDQLLDGSCYSAVSGLNQERIEALKEIDFCWLPSIDENGDITIQSIEEKKAYVRPPQNLIAKRIPTRKTVLEVPPPKKEKTFIPFPWDEI